MEIQQALAQRGYYDGPVDGVWSAASIEALRKFQADQNLEPDGKLGALSLIALGLGPKRTPLEMTSTDASTGGDADAVRNAQPQNFLSKPETDLAP